MDINQKPWIALASCALLLASTTSGTAMQLVEDSSLPPTFALGEEWVEVVTVGGESIWDACTPMFTNQNAQWRRCYGEFVRLNLAAGHPMYKVGDEYHLIKGQVYIAPKPLPVVTAEQALSVAQIAQTLAQGNQQKISALSQQIASLDGDWQQLAEHLISVSTIAGEAKELAGDAFLKADSAADRANQAVEAVEKLTDKLPGEIAAAVETKLQNQLPSEIKKEVSRQLDEQVPFNLQPRNAGLLGLVVGVSTALALVALIWLWLLRKPRKTLREKVEANDKLLNDPGGVIARQRALANDQKALAAEVHDEGDGLAATRTKANQALDRIDEVRAGLEALIEIDADGRLSAAGFTNETLKELGDKPFVLKMPGQGNARPQVHIYNRGEYLELLGLEKGHDRVDKIDAIAVYRFLAKAMRPENDWIIGITAARKAA